MTAGRILIDNQCSLRVPRLKNPNPAALKADRQPGAVLIQGEHLVGRIGKPVIDRYLHLLAFKGALAYFFPIRNPV